MEGRPFNNGERQGSRQNTRLKKKKNEGHLTQELLQNKRPFQKNEIKHSQTLSQNISNVCLYNLSSVDDRKGKGKGRLHPSHPLTTSRQNAMLTLGVVLLDLTVLMQASCSRTLKRTVLERGRHCPMVTMSPSFTFCQQGEQCTVMFLWRFSNLRSETPHAKQK